MSATKVLDISEDLDASPDVVPALHLGGNDDIDHLEAGKQECEHDKVKEIQKNNVEGPSHHVVVRVEDVKHDHADSHDQVH